VVSNGPGRINQAFSVRSSTWPKSQLRADWAVWQDYRGNTDNDADAYRVITTARLTGLPKKDGPRRVCVRVVDVFGFEAEATVEVA